MMGLFILLISALVLLLALITALMVRRAQHPPRRTAAYAMTAGLPADPEEIGLTFDAWWLDRPDGARLHVWEIQPPNQSPHGRTDDIDAVIILHGWAQSKVDHLPRARWWLERRRRVVLYDLRGHGESTGPSRLGHDEERDLLALIKRLDAQRILLVGHSMGGVIALQAAAQEEAVPQRIAGVIAYGPYLRFHESLRGRLQVQQLPHWPFTTLIMLWLRLRGLRQEDLETRVERIACPLLIVHGHHDRVSPFAHAEAIVAHAPDARLYEVPGGRHSDAHEVDPKEHERQLEEFLEHIFDAESPTDGETADERG